MGVGAVAIAAVIVSAASAGYSMYTQEQNADKQEAALEEQKRQEADRAAEQADRMKEDNLRLQGRQRAALASAGVDLNGGGTADVLKNETITLGNRDQNSLTTDLNNRISSINAQQSMIPSGAEIATTNLLNFGASVLNTYSGYKTSQTNQALLARPTTTTTGPVNMFTGTATQGSKYTLLG